jgi:hypothetical protein
MRQHKFFDLHGLKRFERESRHPSSNVHHKCKMVFFKTVIRQQQKRNDNQIKSNKSTHERVFQVVYNVIDNIVAFIAHHSIVNPNGYDGTVVTELSFSCSQHKPFQLLKIESSSIQKCSFYI